MSDSSEAVHDGHLEVHQDNVVSTQLARRIVPALAVGLVDAHECLLPVVGRVAHKTGFDQLALEHGLVNNVVLDDEEAKSLGRLGGNRLLHWLRRWRFGGRVFHRSNAQCLGRGDGEWRG